MDIMRRHHMILILIFFASIFYILAFQVEESDLPTIYVVTPTYHRPEMAPELTRLGQTLLLVPKVHWIVAEDADKCSPMVKDLLERLGLPYTHIISPMPKVYNKLSPKPRGVSNRRAALQWVRDNGSPNGVLFFLDDDNSVDIRLFEEMRDTQKVSMWPVGLIGMYSVSSPVVNADGIVTGFFDGWPAGRKFQIDMAGFAVNVGFLRSRRNASMPYIPGYEEDGFLKSIGLNLSDVEVKANGCTEILVWHTRTLENKLRSISTSGHFNDNISNLLNIMKQWSMIK